MTDYVYEAKPYDAVQLSNPAGGTNYFFGSGVDVDGNTLVVGEYWNNTGGAQAGRAWIYERASSSDPWVATKTIDGVSSSRYLGTSVAVSGDTVVVGEPYGNNYGDVQIWRKTAGVWALEQAYLGSAWYGRHGQAVDIQGDRCVFGGASGTGTGVAVVGMRTGTSWTFTDLVPAVAMDAYDAYGQSVSIDGDWIAIGAWGDDDTVGGAGAVYIWHWNGSAWVETQKIQASDASGTAYFGRAVALKDGVLAVSSANSAAAGAGSGCLHIFTESGGTWSEVQTSITPISLKAGDKLGGDYQSGGLATLTGYETTSGGVGFLVGAATGESDYLSVSGVAFALESDDWSVDWTEHRISQAPAAANDYFGFSVGTDGTTFVVGGYRALSTWGAAWAWEPDWISGSTDITDPVVTIISPAVGSTITKNQTLTLTITDEVALRVVVLMARYGGSFATEVIWNGGLNSGTGAFLFPFATSTRTAISGGHSYTLTRTDGWPTSPTIDVVAVDTGGNDA